MRPRELARKIGKVRPHPPITLRLERDMQARGRGEPKEVWYRSQKEHWLGWLSEYNGPGYYGRKDSRRTAEFVYNHINCAPMLLWLAEVSGVSSALLKLAAHEALQARSPNAGASAAVRRVIPWAEIERRLTPISGRRKLAAVRRSIKAEQPCAPTVGSPSLRHPSKGP
jgi:hypothetical protein